MKELIVGTGNVAKKKALQSVFASLGVTIRGTDDLGISLDIQEDGATAQENSRKKALAYAQVAMQSVLSFDNALYLDGIAVSEQPGIHTRRIPGKADRATDEELLAFYAHTIKQVGGRINGQWEYAICLADAQARVKEKTFLTQRIFVAEPSMALIAGYPLASLQIDPESGKYIAEMMEEEQSAFWQNTIGKPLVDFVQEAEHTFFFQER